MAFKVIDYLCFCENTLASLAFDIAIFLMEEHMSLAVLDLVEN